jgi:hypothetical protein
VNAPLPPFRVVESALRKTTERLVREIAEPREQAPEWNAFEWSIAKAVCALHGISAVLANRLRWRGPEDWLAFLHDQRAQGLVCHGRAGRILAALDARASRDGLSYVALKGSALREYALHRPGERPMSDIDMLVRPADAALAARVITDVGYERSFASRRHEVFVPLAREQPHAFAEHARNPLRIELHQAVSEALPVRTIDITARILPARPRAGANPYPGAAALLRHLLLHTAGNMRAHAMRFMQLYDCALLARRLCAADWDELLGNDPRNESWWLYPPLRLAERYLPGSVPAEVQQAFAAICPRWLRRRFERLRVYDVSWSNFRIAALPGIEWSRTPADVLGLLKSRLLPRRAALDELTVTINTQPALLNTRWYGVSHAERILRWTFSRTPRVQTLCCVRAALEHPAVPGRP